VFSVSFCSYRARKGDVEDKKQKISIIEEHHEVGDETVT
jgi:hypothetical protein